jgi:hypothetical protein
MRTIVVVSDQTAYVGRLVMVEYAHLGAAAAAAMDAFVARYRAAGWRVVDHRATATTAA